MQSYATHSGPRYSTEKNEAVPVELPIADRAAPEFCNTVRDAVSPPIRGINGLETGVVT